MSDQELFFGGERFKVIKKIGEGGLAIVYLVKDTELGVFRALKVLNPCLQQSLSVQKRFRDEARIMADLQNPNTVIVYDFHRGDTESWILMEFVDGCSLVDRLEIEVLPPRLAAEVCLVVLSVLAEAHKRGVIHRDIKPANILLSHDGEIKLVDFGIAKLISPERMTRTGTTMGTFGYMAPEQDRNAKDVDARADLYSVAAVLFFCVSGTDPRCLAGVAFDDGILDGIPASLAQIIRKAVNFNREARYASAEEMIAALTKALELLPAVKEDAKPLFLPVEQAVKNDNSKVTSVDCSRIRPPEIVVRSRFVIPDLVTVSKNPPKIKEVPIIDPPVHRILWWRVALAVLMLFFLVSALIGGIWQLARSDNESTLQPVQ